MSARSKHEPGATGAPVYSEPSGRSLWALFLVFLLVALALIAGCRRFDLTSVLDGPSGLPLTISPASTTVQATTVLSFTAEGGVPPYTYTVIGDGAITPDGQYTAPPTTGTDVVRVTDAAGRDDEARVEITNFLGGLVITPTVLSLTVNGSLTFAAIGGAEPYTFAITTPGSGTPTINPTTGYYVAGASAGTDQVRVTDWDGSTADATVTVTTASTNVDYTIDSTSFPAGGTAGTAIPAGQEFWIQNIGSGDGTAAVSWKLYLSEDAVLGGGDVVIDSGSFSGLAAGGSTPVTVSGTWPNLIGSYYLIVEVNSADDMTPGNNISAASPLTLNPKNIDYEVQSVVHVSGTTTGGAVTGEFDYGNVGSHAGTASLYYEVYASTDAVLDAGDTLMATGSLGALGAGALGSKSFSGVWPTTPGSYYLIVSLDASEDVNAGNDARATLSSVSVTGVAPAAVDYLVTSVTNTGSTYKGGALSGEFVYRNQGADAGSGSVYWNLYVSTDAVLDVGTDLMVDSGTVGALGAGVSSVPVAFSGTWPSAAGTHYLIARVSSNEDVDNGNNTTASAAVVVSAPNVDYAVSSVSSTGGSTAGYGLTGQFSVQNAGTVGGAQSVYWTAYVSTNATLEVGTDPVLDSGSFGALGAGATAGPVAFSGTWPASAGTYYLIVRVTADDDINGSNNTAASAAVTVTAPSVDYYPSALSSTGTTIAGGALSGQLTIQRNSGDPGTASVHWRVYVSTDTVLNVGVDPIVASGNIAALPSGGSAGPISFSGTWPAAADTYYLIASLSAGDDVNSANDMLASSAVAVTPKHIDYEVQSVVHLSGTTTGGAVEGSFGYGNVGSHAGTASLYYEVYASTDAVLDAGDTLMATGSLGALNAGATGSKSFSGVWPTTSGSYYLIARLAASEDVNAANDTLAAGSSVSVTGVSPAAVDYLVTSVTNTGSTYTGGALSGEFVYRNQGADAGSGSVYWNLYVSTDAVLDVGTDLMVDSGTVGALAAGADSSPVAFSGTWPSAANTYYLIARVSSGEDVDNGNNTAASAAVVVSAPNVDYAVSLVNSSGGTTAGYGLTGQFSVQNVGAVGGAQSVYWTAYVSTNATLEVGTDPVLDSGSFGALGAGATAGPVAFSGTWPGTAGTYYLIVRLSAGDDVNSGNDVLASGAVTVNAPNVDYSLTAVSNTGGTTTGGALAGSFTVRNAGTDNGAYSLYWTAYLSSDGTLDPGVDTVIDSGSLGSLASATETTESFSGTWPGSAGTWYLIVKVEAWDDVNGGNNTRASGGVSVSAPAAQPNYAVTALTAATQASAGELFSAAGVHSFTIEETAGNAGSQPISWWVYVSTDTILDAGDAPAATSGSRPALGAGGSATVTFDGTWPSTTGLYYLIVRISASDDSEPADDTRVSARIAVPLVFTETEPNNDDKKPFTLSNDVGTLNANEVLAVSANMDTAGGYDTFKFTPGPGATTVEIWAEWSTGFDDIDLRLWDPSVTPTTELISQAVSADTEPANPPWAITGLTPGTPYYVGVYFYLGGGGSGSAGQPYTLYIYMKP